MRESRLMQVQYVTAIAALLLVGLHLLMQGVLVPYGVAISFQHILLIYRSWINGSLLEILLIVVLAHGFNGARIILVEWKQTKGWTTWINRGVLVAALLAIAYGTRTVILAAAGGVS
jgi:succinate dehydrogenase / fumarate reductase membrane anchor subunit